jgi:hypothetical protein
MVNQGESNLIKGKKTGNRHALVTCRAEAKRAKVGKGGKCGFAL